MPNCLSLDIKAILLGGEAQPLGRFFERTIPVTVGKLIDPGALLLGDLLPATTLADEVKDFPKPTEGDSVPIAHPPRVRVAQGELARAYPFMILVLIYPVELT